MKKLNFLSNLWSLLVGSQKDESRTRLRVVFDSFTCRLRVLPLKIVAVLAILLTIGGGQMWGAVYTGDFTDGIPTGWSATGSKKTGYYQLGTTNDYIQTPTFSVAASGSISVMINAYVTGSSKSSSCSLIGYNASNKAVETKSVTCSSSSMTSSYPTTTWTLTNSGNDIKYVKFVYTKATSSNMRVSAFKVTFPTTITLNKNGGADNGSVKYDNEATTYVTSSFTAVTRSGYTCTGYYTATTSGTKILNADGTLASASITVNTVPYTDSNKKWVYADASLTLYAQWESAAACTATPSIGAASLNGSFNLSSVGVSCASITPGTNCSVASGDYGFIWYQGSSSDKKIGDTGVTKVAITSGAYSSGSFSTNLSSTFSVDQTYTFRAFATNGKPATVYSSEVGFTPRSITFNSNGGSSVSTIYLNSGSTATEPTAPTKAGSVFAGWYSNEGLTTAVDWSSTISTSKTYYAKWYTVTVNVKDEAGNSLSGTGKPTASCSGTTLSTSAGSEKYVFKEWEVSNTAALGSSKTSASNSLTSITGNVTVTAIYHAPITLTKGTNTGASTFNFSSNPIGYGETLTITCAADASHKGNPTVTASGTHGAISVVSATSVTIANVQSAMTVNISYTAKEAAVVKLHVAGTTSTISGTRYEGDSYTLPDEATECPDLGLYGWYEEDYSDEDDAPTGSKFHSKGASVSLGAGDNDFYAVYATIGATADTYTKITTTGELTSGDYLIAGISSWCMSNTVNASNYMNEVAMSSYYNSTTGVITNTSNSDLIWTITKSGDNYTLYNAAAKKYLALTTTSPALSDAAHNFTVSLSGSCWCFSSTTTTGYMLVYSTYFKSLTAKSSDVLLYKRDQAISGPYTTDPSCTTHSLTVAADPVAGGSATAVKTVLGETKTTTANATPNSHYDFAYWTISGTGSTMSNTSDGKSTDNPVTVTMGTEDATLTAHFTEKEKCTVVFKNNGVQVSSTTYWRGENPVAPTLTDGTSNDACDETSDKHYGWTMRTWTSTIADRSTVDARTGAETVYFKTTTLPAIVAGDDGTTITYHAVWASGEGSPSIPNTLIAKWDKQSIAASTAIKAKDKDGNTLNSVTMTSNIAMSTNAVYCYANTSISTDPVITLAGLDFSDYNAGVITFFARGSQQALVSVEYSTDGGSSYSTDHFSDGTAKNELGYVVTVPNTTTNVKISYGSNTGNFYFGTVRAYGKTTTSYDFTELTSSNTSGWSGAAWDGYYLIVGNSKTKALRSDIMEGLYGMTTVSPSEGIISTSDLGLIFKATYNSSTSKYTIRSAATQDYLTDNYEGFSEKYHLLETAATENISIAYSDIENASEAYVRWYSDRFGSYGTGTSPTLYKIMSAYSTFLTTCCNNNVTLATNSPENGTITFSPEGTISTCSEDASNRQTTMTVTPNAGYYLYAWSTTGVTPYSVSPAIEYGSTSNSGAQATTVTFTKNTTTGTYTANATFSPIPVSSLTLHAIKKDNTSATIFEETGNNVALSLYPTEGKTASPADPLGHTVKIEFGAVLPANALNKGYTWSATVNGEDVGWSSNNLETNAVLEFNKSTGKVVAKAAGTAEIIITADDGSGVTAKVTITVTNVVLSSLNVAKSSTTLYVGESEEIAVTYDPANTTTKGYTTGSYTYVTVSRANDKITLTGKATTSDVTERVTLTSSDAGAKKATIDVTVKPLPKVTFVDKLQGKTDFTNWGTDGVVSSTVADGVVTHTKPTPSHTDISDPGASYNACERNHLHLVGWIESEWADAHPNATHEQIVGANASNGAGTFLEAGADFNVETYNGNTYYAVWSKID